MNDLKKELENELSNLLSKYKNLLKLGDITESIIGLMTCVCFCAAYKKGEHEELEEDLKNIISKNIVKCKKHYLIGE